MRALLFLIGLSVVTFGGCAAPLPFAPDIEEYAFEADRDLSGVWSKEGVAGFERRLRLTIRPSLFRTSAVIRIDVPEHGSPIGHAVRTRRSVHDRKVVERRTFSITPDQLARLDTLIADSGLWKFEHEVWETKAPEGRDVVCIDGVQLVFERATKVGYHFSEANAQCTAPVRLLRVAKEMIDLAGLDEAELGSWLE